MKVRVNGEMKELALERAVLTDLLKQFGIQFKGIAIELNKVVVSRDAWEKTNVREGDQIEIVHFVGGGI